MINITRPDEPDMLRVVRDGQLPRLRALAAKIKSEDIVGYAIVAKPLWSAQMHKCCYCEQRITCSYNDVEHFRPKARAERMPGCPLTHGYWWLSFSWSNLLFSCAPCNRSSKKSKFPLLEGAVSLVDEELPPGLEVPLILDPAGLVNPVLHIKYEYEPDVSGSRWWARPRNGSCFGAVTIEVCGLNRQELLELREDHYICNVKTRICKINDAIDVGDIVQVRSLYEEACSLFGRRGEFSLMTYDAFVSGVCGFRLSAALGVEWPDELGVGV